MSRSPALPVAATPVEPQVALAAARMLNLALCGLTSMLIVVRLVTTTEAAFSGDTLWIAQLSLFGLLLWVLARYAAGQLSIRFGWLDLGVALLVGGHVLGSVIVVCNTGDQRAALNLLWEWVGVGATFFLVRQMQGCTELTPDDARRWLITPVVLLGVAAAGLGIWQHTIGHARTAAAYTRLTSQWDELNAHRRPQDSGWQQSVRRLRQELMLNDIPLEAQDRTGWEQRVLHSTEPFGFFALANSFAGWLAVVLIFLVASAGSALRTPASLQGPAASTSSLQKRTWLVLTLLTIPTAYCLLLTKSRTAWIGTAVGVMALVIGAWLGHRREYGQGAGSPLRSRALPWTLAGLLLAGTCLIGCVWWSGGLDKFVVLEAGKSLRYRLEWWTSVRQMLTSNWRWALVGVGPGNFRQHYLAYKLPESSEEIADPHNLFLDVWANGGVAGLAGLMLIIVWTLVTTWRNLQRAEPDEGIAQAEFQHSDGPGRTGGRRFGDFVHDPIPWIIGLGCGAALLVQSEIEQLGGVIVGAICVAICVSHDKHAVRKGGLTTAAAFVALAVHLLGAGGIGMPAISLLLLLLAALCETSPRSWAGSDFDPAWKFGIALAVTLALFFAGWWNFTEVLTAGNEMARGDDAMNRGQLQLAEQAYRRAAQADPWSLEPLRKQVATMFERYWRVEREDPKLFDQAVGLQRKVVARDPRAYSGYLSVGDLYFRRFGRTQQPADARSAAEWYGRALERHPTLASLHVQAARGWWQGNETSKARAAARRALELHEINVKAGHSDKQLPPATVRTMQDFLTSDPPAARR